MVAIMSTNLVSDNDGDLPVSVLGFACDEDGDETSSGRDQAMVDEDAKGAMVDVEENQADASHDNALTEMKDDTGEAGNKPVPDCAHDRRRYCRNSFNIHLKSVLEILNNKKYLFIYSRFLCVENGIGSSKLSSKLEISNLLESRLGAGEQAGADELQFETNLANFLSHLSQYR